MADEIFDHEDSKPLEGAAVATPENPNRDGLTKILAINVAHELANPLDAVRRYVNLAMDQVMEDSLAREYLLRAKKGMAQILHIIKDLQVFSRQDHKGRPHVVELHELIHQTLDAVREDEAFRKISIRELFSEEGPVYVEDHGLSILFRNLYKNARQEMKEEGVLTVGTRVWNGSVKVTVQDSGSGIPANIREHIFEPFFSTKDRSEGTGIGLTLCREIVEQCGGMLTCENSVPPPGACFIFTLPRK